MNLQRGISPKVLLPFIGGIAAGAILLIAGLAAHDSALKVAGTSILLAAAVHAGIGYQAPPGEVTKTP